MKITNQIKRFDVSRLRVSEQIEFYGIINDIVEKRDPIAMGVDEALEEMKQSYVDVESKFKRSRNSKITAQLIAMDKLRDSDIACLRMTVDAMTRHFDPEIKAAAEILLEIINQYGTAIYDMNYEEETAVLRNLVTDLSKKKDLAKAVKKLNLGNLVANLEKNNNEFREIYKSRLEETTYNNEISAGEALRELLSKYRVLIRTLESRAFLEPSDKLNHTIAEINTLAERQIEKINDREARRANGLDNVKPEENEEFDRVEG